MQLWKTAGSIARSGAIVLLALAGLTCRDRSPTGPGLPVRAHLSVAPAFQIADGAPELRLHRVRAQVWRHPSGVFVLDTSAFFDASSNTLRLDIPVTLERADETFRLVLSAYTTAGDLAFSSDDTVGASAPGAIGTPIEPILTYVGSDTAVAAVAVSPRDTVLTVGATFQYRSVARRSDSTTVAALIGWTSSDTGAIAIDRGTGLATAKREFSGVWIRATTLNLKVDSTRVGATAAVASVVVTPNPASVAEGDSVQLSASVRDASGGPLPTRPVSWSSTNPSVARVSATGRVTGVGAGGPVTITASSGGVSGTASVTVTPKPVAQVILAPDTTITAGDSFTVRVELRAADGSTLTGRTVTYHTTIPAVASVTAAGTVLGLSAGTTPLVASAEGVTDTVMITVIQKTVAYVTLSPDTAILAGESFFLTVGAFAADSTPVFGRPVGYASSDSSVATVDPTAKVTGVAPGTALISAVVDGHADTVTVVVAAGVNGAVVSPDSVRLNSLGDTVQLAAQAYEDSLPVTGSFTWASRDPAIASVDTVGRVIAQANGSTWVVATESAGARDSSRVVVQQEVSTVTVTPGSRTLYLGTNFQLAAAAVDGRGNAMPAGTVFSWSSSSPTVVRVDSATGAIDALALGTAQVRATAGGVTGTATITVVSAIQRIALTPDSVTLTALGIPQQFTAVAYDTLDAPMNGITFAWTSTNPSVAGLDSTGPTGARAVSAANGVTSVRATAQGVFGAATLRVQQVLSSIELLPTSVSVGPGGRVTLIARGKDSNNRYLSGGTFTWNSDNTAAATVDGAGVVTGVAVGTTNVTAYSGAITSNPSVVTVTDQVPPTLRFAKDTLSVGRGSSVSIPLFLSKPSPTPVVVNLTALDTVAYFPTPKVTFPAGVTSINVTLSGRNAGTTMVIAGDSAFVYQGDTAVVKVQATMRLQHSSIGINETDQFPTQVLLSDPSPAGGTYVTFNFSVAGIAAVSPDPAFIPGGQLAADVMVSAIGSGSTQITPVAAGVNGTATSFTAYAAKLQFSTSLRRLGAGQYQPDDYAYVPTTLSYPLPLNYQVEDTTIARLPASGTIPGGSYYSYFTVSAFAPGTARAFVSAVGTTGAAWEPDTTTIVVTSPKVGICCNRSLNTTSPIQTLTVYAEDSLNSAHYRISSLVVNLRSSDPAVVQMVDTQVTIGAGQYYYSGGRYRAVGGGTAWIRATAGGHFSDSVQVSVAAPKLQVSFSTYRLGVGQTSGAGDHYVYTPDNVTAPLEVRITSADPGLVRVDTQLTIPVGTYYAYFRVEGLGYATSLPVVVTAAGYTPDTGYVTVTTPRVTSCCSATVNNFSGDRTFTVYATDSVGTAHYVIDTVRIGLASSDPAVVTIDSSTVTIMPGEYYDNTARLRIVGEGTARIRVTGPAGYINDTSIVITVVRPKVQLSFGTVRLGRRQFVSDNNVYVYVPDNRTSALDVTVTQLHPERVRLRQLDSAGATSIPQGTYYRYFSYDGLELGADTIIVSAPGYNPDTGYVIVTSTRLSASNISGSGTTTDPPRTVTVYTTDSVGTSHYTLDTITVLASSSDTTVLRLDSAVYHVPAGQYYTNAIRYRNIGPGTAYLVFADSAGVYAPDTTNSSTITGPALRFSSSSARLGMRQNSPSDHYVYTENNVSDTLVVYLTSTDPRVGTVPDSVLILPGLYYAYFPITAQDTVGTIQLQATALGHSPTTMSLQVTRPKFSVSTNTSVYTTTPPQTITVYATDAAGTSHYVNEDVVVSLVSSAPGVATPDSMTVTIRAGQYYTQAARMRFHATGTARLTASDARLGQPTPPYYYYDEGFADIAVNLPPVQFSISSSNLGIGQYIDPYVHVPYSTTAPATVTLTHAGSERASVPATVTIDSGTSYVYFRVTGLTVGVDTIVATTPGHAPDTMYINVGTPTTALGNWSTTMNSGAVRSVTLYTRDQGNTDRYVADTTSFTLTPNANVGVYSDAAATIPITTVTVPADAYYTPTFYVKALGAGTGTLAITAAGYATTNLTTTISAPAPRTVGGSP